ncbi:MAG TPA: CD1871A family CXXC motif-containing protein [Treponemataceae bacterium]|jgi:hypothetical protein|nr:CD1871A family CXXC motif-containing protein [Treponemataceae bacterium]HOS30909.1 CD1871A family CXXC motif-containing protein [Treponemataceae bacterium]
MKNRIRVSKNLSLILIIASILFITAGLLQGDFFSVMGKAVFICLECIGIG